MDIYRFCLYLGFTGMACMALLGMSHSMHGLEQGGHSGGHGGGHGGHGGHDVGHAGHHTPLVHHTPLSHHGGHDSAGHTHVGHHGQHDYAQSYGGRDWFGIMMGWLSPRAFFSVLLGFGATGILIKALVPEARLVETLVAYSWLGDPEFVARAGRFGAAMIGGWGFERCVVRPVWNFLLGFGSNPARTLESAVCEEARAVTGFDAAGNGLISVDLGGEVVQVLGTLSTRAKEDGVRVRAGDRLFVEDVDTQRNSCTVSPFDR